MKAPIAYIQHFLTLLNDINTSAVLVQDPHHPQTLFVAKSPFAAACWARKFLSTDEWSQVSGLPLQLFQEKGKEIEEDPTLAGDEITLTSKH